MKSKRLLADFAAVKIGLLCAAFLMGCMEKDGYFGSEFVPAHQLMSAKTDSTVRVRTYIDRYDSVQTSFAEQFEPGVGSHRDPLVGRVTTRFFVNYAPIGFTHSEYFGIEPEIDSMLLSVTVSSAFGDTTSVNHWIDVYEVEGFVAKSDSAYYSNFDMSPYISGTPLVSFQMQKPGLKVIRLPDEFARKHLDNTPGESNLYYIDTNFHKTFNGLYFRFRDETPVGEGTVFQVDLVQSVMNLFFHNKGYNYEPTPEPDTTTQRMMFAGDYVFYNTNFMMVEHDYTESDPSQGGVRVSQIGDLTIPSEYGYVEGLAGLMTRIQVDESDIQRIRDHAAASGYGHVALQKAELQVTTVDPGYEEYKKTFAGLGIYRSMLKPDFLDEYNPVLEAVYGSGYTSSLGGGLSRSKGYYTFNITSYVQQLFTGKKTEFMTEIGPDYSSQNSLSRTRVYGYDSPYPPRLILTYIMVK